jgi:hypothetical protein
MLGWGIFVSTLSKEENDRADTATIRASLLASWETTGLLKWLDELVASGKAVQHSRGGYPNLYTAKAGDVLPLIEDGRIDDWKYAKIYMKQIHKDRMSACRDEQVLTIEVWDQS